MREVKSFVLLPFIRVREFIRTHPLICTLLGLGLLLALLAGETIVKAEAPTASTTPGEATYVLRDTVANYEVDYPASWRVEANEGWLSTLYSYAAGSVPDNDTVKPPLAKIEFVPVQEPATLDSLFAQVQSQQADIRDRRTISVNGVPALQIDLMTYSAEPARLVLIILDGHALQVMGYGDLNAFDGVLKTLRPAASSLPRV